MNRSATRSPSGGSSSRGGGRSDRPRRAATRFSAGRWSAAHAARLRATRGQASVLIVAGLGGVLVAALIVGAVARAVGKEAAAQRAADLGALAGAKAMHANYERLFEPVTIRHRPNPLHLEKSEYLALGQAAAEQVARANGARTAVVTFPDGKSIAPLRVHVAVREDISIHSGHAHRQTAVVASAEAELALSAAAMFGSGGGYDGPLAYRQGKPMRPDVALAFDRMAVAATADGVSLIINSAYRSDAEQAVLWARHPDPKWVARPGTSLHRYATELDLGPPSAYGWLAAHATTFHFLQRYSWEPWHYGYTLNNQSHPTTASNASPSPTAASNASPSPTSTPRGRSADADDDPDTAPAGGDGAAGVSHGAVPGFVPAAYAAILARAAQRWNVSAALLAAQLYQESGFNPFARSKVGALGIAQFMPATARGMGLADPFDPAQAIDAQAHLMRDLLRQFGSVPLALAAYNAGPSRVAACGCVPNIPETQGYVASILGLMGGAGQPVVPGDGTGLEVRLIG
jgi:Transglycosylase SLT domain/D-alanyl-D-alanine carboxypeptidase